MFSGAGSSVHRALVLLGGLAIGLPLLPTPMVARSEAQAPELPRVFLDTALVVPSGQTIAVPTGGDVQAALDAAQPGDVITLQAGATFRGPFTLPNKVGPGWITVRTSAPDSSLPPPETRVNPSYAAMMPKLVVGAGATGAIRAAAGAHHFRLIGLEMKPLAGAQVYGLIELGQGNETSEATLPHDIIIDRCYIHGNPGEASKRGVLLNGSRLAVIDSYLADFKDRAQDTQAIMGYNGPGPFKIVNNYLEAAGENVMFGGADAPIGNLVPSDIEIRHNHFFKPTSWRGVWAAVKNLFELKNARRVVVEGNIFENNWLAAQTGWAIQFTVRNQNGGAPWSTIEDVTFQRNIVRYAGSGLNILAADDPNPSQTMKRVLIRHNLFDDITGSTWGGFGRLFQILGWAGGSTDLVIEHNTAFQQENVSYAEGLPNYGFVFRNNLTPRGSVGWGFMGAGTFEGLSALAAYFPLAVFLNNVMAGGNAAIYPPANFFPSSLAAVGFVDLAARNYRLATSSQFKNAATDGSDIGADIDAVKAATADVISGAPGTPDDTTPPTAAISSPTAGETVRGVVTIAASASDNVGVTRLDYVRDGQVLWVSSPPVFTFAWTTTTVSNGSHSLSARAYDAAGNVTTSAGVAVIVDNPDVTPPTVTITSPTSNPTYTTSTSSLTLGGTAADNIGVTQVMWNTGSASGTATGTTTWTASGIVLQLGENVITVTARDAAGNTATDTVTVTFTDATPPTVTITSPTADPTYTTSASSLALAGTAADNVEVTQVTWENKRGGRGTATGTTTWTASGIVLQPGTNELTVTARDAAGNTATDTVTVTFTDTTPPTVTITSPTANPTYTASASSLTLAGTAADNIEVTQVTWENSGSGRGTAIGTTSWTASGIVLQLGENVITVTARDAAGNTATDSVTVTLRETFTFADDPLIEENTPIKAEHILELRAAIDRVRVARGLAAFTWTDPTLTPESTPIKAVHLTELRTALNQAYEAAGRVLPTYIDPVISTDPTGTDPSALIVIKAIHLNELRTAIRAL